MDSLVRIKPNFLFFFFFFSFLAVVPSLRANIGEFDDFWQKRAQESRAATINAFNPNPQEISDDLFGEVKAALQGNSTRRHLKKYTGKCMATNPIDRCWRCQADWARHRKKLSRCVLGFGRRTIGGRNGKIYVVTDASDNDLVNPKKGTLRWGVIQDVPLWIIFARDMIIRLNEELIVNSHKTIDGRGANVHIAGGAGITIQHVQNVIIHGLHIHDVKTGSGGMIRDSINHYGYRTKSDGDGISIFGSTNVWIDHISMSNCMDGLIDTIMGSTAVTLSNNHMTHHNDVMLMGASKLHTMDVLMQVTVAFNHFGRGLVQRMPRCRYGFFHVLNNDYTHWLMYAIGGSQNPTIISQGNRFIAPPDINAKEVTHREEGDWKNWQWRSEGDQMMNGAYFVQSGQPRLKRGYSRHDMINAKPGSFVKRLTRFAGALNCRKNFEC
ncbi:pectate lyase-like [Magnolia sinica]|uniref:pectate lyase-like n=1 Tax=Magnolia sinica TaxID=86752 RepID=UPI00265949E2|nr:pectate lyase-like [Magnolia sinica]